MTSQTNQTIAAAHETIAAGPGGDPTMISGAGRQPSWPGGPPPGQPWQSWPPPYPPGPPMPGYPVGSYAAPPLPPPARRSVWRAALWAVMTLSLLVVIGSMVWFVALRNGAGPEPAAGPQATATASPTEQAEPQPEQARGKVPAQTRTVVAAAPPPRTVVAPARTVTVTPSDEGSVDESDVESYGGGGGAVTSLPSGTYVMILDSLPKGRYSLDTAQQRAAAAGSGVFVVDSDPIPGLNSGYWALTVGPYSTRSEARSVCASYGRSVGGTCYDRRIG